MFTGIIEKLAPVEQISPSQKGAELKFVIQTGYDALELGESIAVNGVCLTVAEILPDSRAVFYMSAETLSRSNLGEVKTQQSVNLERAMQANARLSGHIVQGHVDGVGSLLSTEKQGECYLLEFSIPANLSRYIVEKGSICLNGVSLTVNRIQAREGSAQVSITLIPHTWEHTQFNELKPGAAINIEVDVLAKYVEKLCQPHLQRPLASN